MTISILGLKLQVRALAVIHRWFETHRIVPHPGENSVTGPGIGALLAQLVWALAGEGEGVLMSVVRSFFF
jgi:hypothetical protein